MPIDIRILQCGDEAVLAHGAGDVFDDPMDAATVRAFLDDPRHHLVVALEDGVGIGCIAALQYVHPDKPRPERWINEVAVAATH